MIRGDLVEATKGLVGWRGIITDVKQDLKVRKGKVIECIWVTVSWTKNNAVATMPITHFRLVQKALNA